MKAFTIALIASILFLAGCTTAPIKILSKPVDRIPLILPDADRIYKRDIKWIIITPENADKIFAQLKKTGHPVAIIGVTGEGYKVIALSNGDKIKLIRQLQAQISAYKKYYIAVEARDKKYNDDIKKDKAPAK